MSDLQSGKNIFINQHKAQINIQIAPKYHDGKKQYKGETIPAGNILTAPTYHDGKKPHKGKTIPADLADNNHSRQVIAKVGVTADSSSNNHSRQVTEKVGATTYSSRNQNQQLRQSARLKAQAAMLKTKTKP